MDYAMLVLVKHGRMKPLKEKQYNTVRNHARSNDSVVGGGKGTW